MRREIIVAPEAEAEMAEAFDWYDKRLLGLGTDFLLEVDATIRAILHNPQQFPVLYKNIRRGLVRRFPYQILFIFEDDRVIVLAVFHVKRSPKRWMQREL